MRDMIPDPKKRDYLLPPGCKDLIDVLKGSHKKGSDEPAVNLYRVNGQIQATEVIVVDEFGKNLGVILTAHALTLAKNSFKDLIEICPYLNPSVCLLADYGKFRSLRAKQAKKNKHIIICDVSKDQDGPQ